MKLLFVCTENRYRSATAEEMFVGRKGVSVRSAGTASDARVTLSEELIDWADIIIAMERVHVEVIQLKYGKAIISKRLVCLNIVDDFEFMEPKLVKILFRKVEPLLVS